MWTVLAPALALAAAGVGAPAPLPPCGPAIAFPGDIGILAVVHVVKGADGQSHFAADAMTAETRDYLKTGKPFRQINFGAATKVQLVAGPPDVTFPFHASLGHEMFLTLAGESFVTLADGTEKAIRPGTLVVMDDMGSASGHGGRTGPCGYVAIQIVPAPSVPDPARTKKEQ